MKKPLLILETDEEIKRFKKDMDEGELMFEKSQEFFRKQEMQSWKELVGSHWDKIIETLKARNLLPEDYCDEKYGLRFQDGVLYLTDKSESPDSFMEFIGAMLKRPK